MSNLPPSSNNTSKHMFYLRASLIPTVAAMLSYGIAKALSDQFQLDSSTLLGFVAVFIMSLAVYVNSNKPEETLKGAASCFGYVVMGTSALWFIMSNELSNPELTAIVHYFICVPLVLTTLMGVVKSTHHIMFNGDKFYCTAP